MNPMNQVQETTAKAAGPSGNTATTTGARPGPWFKCEHLSDTLSFPGQCLLITHLHKTTGDSQCLVTFNCQWASRPFLMDWRCFELYLENTGQCPGQWQTSLGRLLSGPPLEAGAIGKRSVWIFRSADICFWKWIEEVPPLISSRITCWNEFDIDQS